MKTTQQLSSPWNTRYRIAHTILVLAFLFTGVYFLFLILFPSQSFVFDFKDPLAGKNTLIDPRTLTGESLARGNLSSNAPLLIDAALAYSEYSTLNIDIAPDKKVNFSTGIVTVQKSYRAFFLPDGDPITEMDTSAQKIHSGSLLSFVNGVFLIDGKFVRPIGDAVTFKNLGYTWDDIVPASEEDMGAYEKGKMVTLDNLHPEGTVFYDSDTKHYYLIRDNQKHLITNDAVAQSYLKGTHPILISEQSLTTQESCNLAIHGLIFKDYRCTVPINTLKNLQGDSYRLSVQFDTTTSLQSMNVTFNNTINTSNMRSMISQIKQRILSQYTYEQ